MAHQERSLTRLLLVAVPAGFGGAALYSLGHAWNAGQIAKRARRVTSVARTYTQADDPWVFYGFLALCLVIAGALFFLSWRLYHLTKREPL